MNTLISSYLSSEQYMEDALKKRNAEFRALEEQLRQYEEKVNHQCSLLFLNIIQVKTILDTNF